jgi:hypothetical protein
MGDSRFTFKGKVAVGPQLAVYRAVWRAFCGVSVALGLAAAAMLLSLEVLEVTFLAVVVAVVAAWGLYGSNGDDPRWTRGQVVTAAAATAAVGTLVLGLTVVLGPSVFWLAVLLGASSPPAVLWCSSIAGFGTPVKHLDVPTRSTADLCLQWRDSYEALRQARTDKQRLHIVIERQRCLDELDRRDPEGLQAWLASAASAAGDPARFLKSQ